MTINVSVNIGASINIYILKKLIEALKYAIIVLFILAVAGKGNRKSGNIYAEITSIISGNILFFFYRADFYNNCFT